MRKTMVSKTECLVKGYKLVSEGLGFEPWGWVLHWLCMVLSVLPLWGPGPSTEAMCQMLSWHCSNAIRWPLTRKAVAGHGRWEDPGEAPSSPLWNAKPDSSNGPLTVEDFWECCCFEGNWLNKCCPLTSCYTTLWRMHNQNLKTKSWLFLLWGWRRYLWCYIF